MGPTSKELPEDYLSLAPSKDLPLQIEKNGKIYKFLRTTEKNYSSSALRSLLVSTLAKTIFSAFFALCFQSIRDDWKAVWKGKRTEVIYERFTPAQNYFNKVVIKREEASKPPSREEASKPPSREEAPKPPSREEASKPSSEVSLPLPPTSITPSEVIKAPESLERVKADEGEKRRESIPLPPPISPYTPQVTKILNRYIESSPGSLLTNKEGISIGLTKDQLIQVINQAISVVETTKKNFEHRDMDQSIALKVSGLEEHEFVLIVKKIGSKGAADFTLHSSHALHQKEIIGAGVYGIVSKVFSLTGGQFKIIKENKKAGDTYIQNSQTNILTTAQEISARQQILSEYQFLKSIPKYEWMPKAPRLITSISESGNASGIHFLRSDLISGQNMFQALTRLNIEYERDEKHNRIKNEAGKYIIKKVISEAGILTRASKAVRLQVAKELIKLMINMKEAKITHNDFHGGNLMITGKPGSYKLIPIDFSQARNWKGTANVVPIIKADGSLADVYREDRNVAFKIISGMFSLDEEDEEQNEIASHFRNLVGLSLNLPTDNADFSLNFAKNVLKEALIYLDGQSS